jgi:hypothetical protein
MEDMGTSLIRVLILLAVALFAPAAFAVGPVETSIFAVQNVEVDVTDVDANAAKQKALIEVQMKAFKSLAEKLGNARLVEAVGQFDEKRVLPYLKSLSIEEESISPGRYKGKLTVRFLPNKIRALYGDFGVRVAGEQGPAMLVLAIWKGEDGKNVLWEDNPWRQAWAGLKVEQSQLPIVVPIGDDADQKLITVDDVRAEDELKIEAIRKRYDVKKVIVAYAEPAENGAVHAVMTGQSPLGRLNFDKTYDGETGRVEDSAALAAQRFHGVMLEKFKSGAGKESSAEGDAKKPAEANARKKINVRVAFSGPSEWNGLRSRILTTPGVTGLDVASLGADGAKVSLTFVGTPEDMQNSLQATGLSMTQGEDGWLISPL